jgi:hypothetical protein
MKSALFADEDETLTVRLHDGRADVQIRVDDPNYSKVLRAFVCAMQAHGYSTPDEIEAYLKARDA